MADSRDACLLWPRTAPPPLTHGALRTAPEDFAVEEQMPFALAGSGEHVWLRIRKRGLNTDRVAQLLAKAAGVTRRDVGYAGMKDRHAVTVQWFSLHLPGKEAPDWKAALPPEIEVLETARHTRKLKVGALSGNRFIIVLRDCTGDRGALSGRVEEIRTRGVPNYFGEQRFGRDGGNIERARAMFAGTESVREAATSTSLSCGPRLDPIGETASRTSLSCGPRLDPIGETASRTSLSCGPRLDPIGDRKLRGIYLSAARSLLFNEVLARRVADGTWDRLLEGEAVILAGRRSFSVAAALDAELARRLVEGDIHPSGPLWGRGESPAQGPARSLELAVLREHEDIRQGLERAGLEQERRALRVIPSDLEAEWLDEAALRLRRWDRGEGRAPRMARLRLRFSLPSGSYATAVLRELAVYRDAAAATI